MTGYQRRIVASVILLAALAACHKDEKATGHGTVSGEILPGSVSDAMLPYDSVKSKAPLAPPEVDERSDNGPSDNATASADADSAAPAAVPEVAASPAPALPASGN